MVSSAPADTATRPEIGRTPDNIEMRATTALFDLTVLAIHVYRGMNTCVFFAAKANAITDARRIRYCWLASNNDDVNSIPPVLL